jgi:hypothetical protein
MDKSHDINKHPYTTYNSYSECDNNPTKHVNCLGKQRFNSSKCEVLQAMYNKTEGVIKELQICQTT